MKPIPFEECNCTYAENQPQYGDLPCAKNGDGDLIICWALTRWERWRVLLSGKVWQKIATFDQPLQPQQLRAAKPAMCIGGKTPRRYG